MKANMEILEDELESYEKELKGLSSYLQELKTTTANFGTDAAQYEVDKIEAEHNIKYYQAQIEDIKRQTGESADTKPKQGISSVLFSALGFVAGALFGSRLKSRKGK